MKQSVQKSIKKNNTISGIKQWAEDDRPREKLMQKGQSALSDAELLAILIQNGTREKSAVDLAREILALAGNQLHRLARLNLNDFQQVKGVGPAKAITLMAALELGRRRRSESVAELESVRDSRGIAAILMPIMQDLTHEIFYVLYLNRANKIIHQEMISKGGVESTVADVRIIMKNALSHLASSICIAHNHPSGNLQPSMADRKLTEKVRQAAQLLDIKLLDHLIIGQQSYFSFSDSGLL